MQQQAVGIPRHRQRCPNRAIRVNRIGPELRRAAVELAENVHAKAAVGPIVAEGRTIQPRNVAGRVRSGDRHLQSCCIRRRRGRQQPAGVGLDDQAEAVGLAIEHPQVVAVGRDAGGVLAKRRLAPVSVGAAFLQYRRAALEVVDVPFAAGPLVHRGPSRGPVPVDVDEDQFLDVPIVFHELLDADHGEPAILPSDVADVRRQLHPGQFGAVFGRDSDGFAAGFVVKPQPSAAGGQHRQVTGRGWHGTNDLPIRRQGGRLAQRLEQAVPNQRPQHDVGGAIRPVAEVLLAAPGAVGLLGPQDQRDLLEHDLPR